jgi:uncharacterized membrane protein YfcA
MTGAAISSIFAIGGLVGILSGLPGIGGGVLPVPSLYFFYGHPGRCGVQLSAGLLVAYNW